MSSFFAYAVSVPSQMTKVELRMPLSSAVLSAVTLLSRCGSLHIICGELSDGDRSHPVAETQELSERNFFVFPISLSSRKVACTENVASYIE